MQQLTAILGVPCRQQGKLDEAIDSYRRAVTLNPDLAADSQQSWKCPAGARQIG